MTTYPLTLGAVTFNQGVFEGPNGLQEGLGDVGSKQKAVIREFPGGIVTAQLYGSFPKPIVWSGILFGSNARNRSLQLQKLCDNGQQITLSYAQWNYPGFVQDYQAFVRGPYEVAYKIVFRPLDNQTTVTNGSLPGNNNDTLANAQNTATQQATSPASGGALPPSVAPAVANLNNGINQALQNAGGNPANISPADLAPIQSQVTDLLNTLDPVVNGSDPLASSAAADLSGTVSIMGSSLGNTTPTNIATINVVNPNLYQLASQYYGDPTMYPLIANANGLTDPLPNTNGPITLTIPVQPSSTLASAPTVITDSLVA